MQFLKCLVAFALFVGGVSAQNISYVPLYSTVAFDAQSIDVNKPVGSTSGGGAVSPFGGATYSIPIYIPPGTNGVEPQVSLEYNSLSGAGIAGLGWNISGMSMVSRVASNMYFDGEVVPIELSSSDRFALDGQRLILKTGSHGEAGAEYTTEVESFSTIRLLPVTGSSQGCFEVISKDGIIFQYGFTSDSRFGDENGNVAIFWLLNRVLYPDGNFIDYEYTSVEREEPKLARIKYTGNLTAALQPYNEIKFEYKVRQDGVFSDIRTFYIGGSKMTARHLLDKIEVRAEGNLIKSYSFQYSHNSINSFLSAVTEGDGQGNTLNPTIFQYGEPPVHFQAESTTIPGISNVISFAADFTDDGLNDIVTTSNPSGENMTEFKVWAKSEPNSANYSVVRTQSLPPSTTLYNWRKVGRHNSALSADFDGDGRADVLTMKIAPTEMHTGGALQDLILYRSHYDNVLNFEQISLPIPENFTGVQSAKTWIQLGDFNGDSRTDYLLFMAGVATPDRAFLGSGRTGSWVCSQLVPVGTFAIPVSSWRTSDVSEAIDFDGDGKQELLLIRDEICEVYAIEGPNVRSLYNGNNFNTDFDYHFGDFNGDGKTDILEFNGTQHSFKVYLSTGRGFVESSVSVHIPWPSDIVGGLDDVVLGDFNGDGRSDISYSYNKFKYSTDWQGAYTHYYWGHDVYYSTGDSFSRKTISYEQTTEGPYQPNFAPITPLSNNQNPIRNAPVDLNADGRTDFFSQDGNLITCGYFNRDGNEGRLLKVRNGMGHVSEWTYEKTAANGLLYSRSAATVYYPLSTINPGWTLVASFSIPANHLSKSTFTYHYKGSIFHRQGKGFLGFERFFSQNFSRGVETISENEINTVFYVAQPKKTELKIQGVPKQTTTLENELVPTSSKSFWLKNKKINVVDHLAGTTTTTDFSYDSFGNVTSKSVSIPGVATEVVVTEYGAYFGTKPNKPTLITTTNTRQGESPYQTQTKFNYNGGGQLISQIDFFGLPLAVTTSYGYNSFGNIVSASVSADGIATRGVFTEFDNKGRYAVRMVNELGQASHYTYHLGFGVPTTIQGIDGLITSYHYDSWGNLTGTTFPEGYSTSTALYWDINDFQRYYQETITPGKPVTRVWYDVLGREIKSQTESFDGALVTGSITYNNHGLVQSEIEPRKASEPLVVVTNSYDPYLRLESSGNAERGYTNYTYTYEGGVLKSSVTSPSGSSTRFTDASGKLIAIEDHGGRINYTYFSNGELKEVRKQDGTVLSSGTYDVYGRQITLTDISAGTTQYQYNALGQLVWQKSASGHETTMQYNLLGQVTSRSGVEGTTTYTYGQTNSGSEKVNQIKQIVGFSGESKLYQYDQFGRLSSLTENLDGSHTTSFTYNSLGDLQSVSYPSGLTITNHYNTRGYLDEIRSGSTVLYKTLSTNGQGQVTGYHKGNGKTSSITYVQGFPTEYSTPDVQNYSLNWDYRRVHLMGRTDARPGINKTETFTYDNLSRLTGSSINGMPFTIEYSPDGNISGKSEVGQYSYHASKIHAVTKVTNPAPSSIAVLQQDIAYTPFQQPSVVSEGDIELTYTYGSNYNRIKSELKEGGALKVTRYYFEGGFEKDIRSGTTRYFQYIAGPAGLVAIVESVGGSHVTHYTYTDYLGSILTVTNEAGIIEAEQSFDAWGRRRNPVTWELLSSTAKPEIPVWLIRGYTFHEHLDEFGLINMNGRMYDPVLGRMLSPDNYVVDPLYTQDFNRYTYARNNPLLYTDPDGEFWHIVAGAAIGGVLNLGIQALSGNIKNTGDGLAAFAKGALVGGMSAFGCTNCAAGVLFMGASTAVGSTYIPSYNLSLGGGFSMSVGGNIGFGTTGLFAGVNVSLNYDSEYFSIGVSHSMSMTFRDNITNKVGWSSSSGAGLTIGDRNFRLGLFTNFFAGRDLDQQTGSFYGQYKDWSVTYENDYMFGVPISDGGDRFRTTGVRISKGDYSIGLNLFTGDPGKDRSQRKTEGHNSSTGFLGVYKELAENFRLGALYGGFKGYRFGWTSEGIRNYFQNKLAHGNGYRYPIIKVLNIKGGIYFNHYNTGNPFTTWY